MTRWRALSCSIRAFCLSEFCRAFWQALSAETLPGISSLISLRTRSLSADYIDRRQSAVTRDDAIADKIAEKVAAKLRGNEQG
jgi:hypothetical protein